MTGTGEWGMIRDAREPRNTRAGGAPELELELEPTTSTSPVDRLLPALWHHGGRLAGRYLELLSHRSMRSAANGA